MHESQTRSVSSPSGTTHYAVAGRGDAVIVLHGATMDRRMWAPQVPALAPHYRVIAPDLPRHGASRPYAHFSLDACVEEVFRILDHEQVERAHIVGQSMGGYVGQLMALHHPQRARSLVVVDSSPFNADYYSRLDRGLLALTPFLLRLYPRDMLIRSIAEGVATTDAGIAYARDVLAAMPTQDIAAIMGEVYRGVLQYADRRFTPSCPVLLVYGADDKTGKVIAYTERWAAQEGHPLHVVPRAGHNSNMDNPDNFNAAVLAFLEDVP